MLMSTPRRSTGWRGTALGRCALVSLLWLASCAETPERRQNPYNLVEVGRWGMAVTQLPDESLVVGSSNIISQGEVQRIERGSATLMFEHGASFLEVAGGFLYFANWDGAVLGKQSLEGGEVEWLSPRGDVSGLASDEDYIYWLESRPWGVRRLAHTGGSIELVQETPDLWGQIEVDETHLYWITRQGIARAPKQGGEEEEILDPEGWMPYLDSFPTSFALSDRHVFMASGAGHVGSRGALLRMDKDGSDLTLLAPDQVGAYEATVDAEYVYWVRGDSNDALDYPGFQEIMRMPLAGGKVEVIANRQNGVTDLLPTGEGLYWTCRNERFLDFAPWQ
jgi:hypothetical protein